MDGEHLIADHCNLPMTKTVNEKRAKTVFAELNMDVGSGLNIDLFSNEQIRQSLRVAR